MAGLCIKNEATALEGITTRQNVFEWQQLENAIDAVMQKNVAEQQMQKMQAALQEARQSEDILRENLERVLQENDMLRLQLFHASKTADEVPVDTTWSLADNKKHLLDNICFVLQSTTNYEMLAVKLCHELRRMDVNLYHAALQGFSFKQFVVANSKALCWDKNTVFLRQTKCWYLLSKTKSCPWGEKCRFRH